MCIASFLLNSSLDAENLRSETRRVRSGTEGARSEMRRVRSGSQAERNEPQATKRDPQQ